MPKLTAIRKQALDEMMKESLFEATITVLGDRGADGLTVDRVAAAAGMAKGNVYRYFRGKRQLLQFVFARVVDPILENLEEIAAAEQPAIEKLDRQLDALLKHVAKCATIHKFLFEDDTAHGLLQASRRCSLDAASQQLAGVFRQGIAEGVFRPADPRLLAHMYLGLIKGVLRSPSHLEGTEQRQNVRRLITGTFLNGIATETGRIA